jgi:hypothetical protein
MKVCQRFGAGTGEAGKGSAVTQCAISPAWEEPERYIWRAAPLPSCAHTDRPHPSASSSLLPIFSLLTLSALSTSKMFSCLLAATALVAASVVSAETQQIVVGMNMTRVSPLPSHFHFRETG